MLRVPRPLCTTFWPFNGIRVEYLVDSASLWTSILSGSSKSVAWSSSATTCSSSSSMTTMSGTRSPNPSRSKLISVSMSLNRVGSASSQFIAVNVVVEAAAVVSCWSQESCSALVWAESETSSSFSTDFRTPFSLQRILKKGQFKIYNCYWSLGGRRQNRMRVNRKF